MSVTTIPWQEVVAKLGPHHFMVDDLQAPEPASLTVVDGVLVSWSPRDRDSMGCVRVEVRAATREAILDYARANWGTSDPDWFESHVVGRIVEIGRPAGYDSEAFQKDIANTKVGLLGSPRVRRHLVVRYDVTDLTEAEVDYLSGELHAMAEATSDGADGHPDVPVISVDEIVVAP